MNLEALLVKAHTAKPLHRSYGKWAKLYPVYSQLIQNGFTRDGAIDWLVEQQAVPATQKKQALSALIQVHHRKTKQPKQLHG